MSWRRRSHSIGLIFILAALLCLGACGGSDDTGQTTASEETSGLDSSSDEADPDRPGPTPTTAPAAAATSTAVPSPTPIPSATPEPLEEPTPSTVLLSTAFTNSSKVTTVGIDEVFFGMTAEEAAEAASTDWIGEPDDGSTCYLITPQKGPDGVTLWVVDGHIERVDIDHPDIRTPSGLGIGRSLAELKSQLGDRLSVDSSGDGSQVATFTPTDPGDREFRMIFELVEDQVVSYRSGRIGVIQRAVEGC